MKKNQITLCKERYACSTSVIGLTLLLDDFSKYKK